MRFGVAFKAYLMPDSTDETNAIYQKMFTRFRARQTSIMSAIALFMHNMTQFAALDAPEMQFEDYMPSDFYNLALPNFLDLGDPCMDAFRRRPCKKAG